MKIIIDNIVKEKYECINYPNKEFRKIEMKNIKYNGLNKDIKIEFNNIMEMEDFICELIRENISGKDLKALLGEEFFK